MKEGEREIEMAVAEQRSGSDGKVWGLFKLPFRSAANAMASSTFSSSSSSSASVSLSHPRSRQSSHQVVQGSSPHPSSSNSNPSVTSVARSLWPKKRRLRLDPPKKLYFPFEPGKQVRSAIKIKNTSKSHVAFKFQTTAPKSCFMRPPHAVLDPGECLIATVFKFVEHPENNERPMEQKSTAKFKIMSLKVKGPLDYAPELFDEQKDQVAIEQILRVVFLDVENPNSNSMKALEKLKRQLAEAEAEAQKKPEPAEDAGGKIVGEGLVIDEWKERRERYLARQHGEVVDSM